MPGITNWSEALADPCFWAARYERNHWGERYVEQDIAAFFGRSDEQYEAFLLQLYGDVDMDTPLHADDEVETSLPPDAADEDNDYNDYTEFEYLPPTSILRVAFPENYTWQLEFGAGGEVAHGIYHPQVYPGGRAIAEEGANFELPGLRWAELKQMVACCLPLDWYQDVDPHMLYLLLYPIVDPVTLAEYDEVRQTLRTAWEALRIVPPGQLERWLEGRIHIFEQGRLLRYDAAQGWYDPDERDAQEYAHDPSVIQVTRTIIEGDLWVPDPDGGGWCTHWPVWRSGNYRRDARPFTPFFAMLDRQTQPHV
jgi:hypothetical protein